MITLKIVRIPDIQICNTATTTQISIIRSVTWYEYRKYERLLTITTFNHPERIHLFSTIKVKVIK